MNILEMLWQFKIQLIPMLVAISTYEIIFLIWRLSNKTYYPIYFSVIPAADLNIQFTRYNEMFFEYDEHRKPSEKVVREKHKLIRKYSRFALAISAYVIPGFVAITTAFYFDKSMFLQFLVLFCGYKSIQLVIAAFKGKGCFYPNKRIGLVIIIYFVFVVVTTYVLFTTHAYFRGVIESGSWDSFTHDALKNFGKFAASMLMTMVILPELEIKAIKRIKN